MEAEDEKQIQLWRKVPIDVFINHIIPYTYQKININLLNDIRNFKNDFQMIIDYYYLDMNEVCLLIDLTWFYNGNRKSLAIETNHLFVDILDRNFTFKKLSLDKKMDFIKNNFYFNINTSTHKKKQIFIITIDTE